ncbi:MAG: trimeric intracellular cation channel family protein [Deinococcota bacterium]
MLELLNWLGTLTFAATGALVGIQQRFDIVGVLVLASVTAVGGGSIRDIVVGRLPTAAIRNEPLLWVVALTGLLVFYLDAYLSNDTNPNTHKLKARHARHQRRLQLLVYGLDTLGLAVFAALGAESGLSAGLGMWGVIFTGTVSAVGGGVLRDVLVGKIPGIFYRAGDFYASAGALGALVVFLLYGLNTQIALVAGITSCLLMRVSSRALKLNLPVPRKI